MRRLLPISILGVIMLIAMAAVPMSLTSTPGEQGVDLEFFVFLFAGLWLYWGLGALIVMRADGHVVGWLFAIAAAMMTSVSGCYALGSLFASSHPTDAIDLGLTTVFRSFTSGNSVVVTASTLVVAALFTPLRRRVQRVVDRRFDRARYDAERTSAAFFERLRNEVDIQTVARELDATVRRAMAPAGVGIWLRGPRR